MYNLTPKMARFKLHKESATKSPLAQRFRTNLLRTEIKFHHRRIHQLETQIKALEDPLYSTVTWLFNIRIRAFIKKSIDNYIQSCKQIHQQKLTNLGLNISFDKNESAIFNDTRVTLSQDEIELLSMGLKHAFFPTSIDNNNNNNQTFINRLIVIESSKSNRFNPNHLKRLWKVWTNLINSQYIQSLSLIIYQMLS